MPRDFETLYYEQQASMTEERGMRGAEMRELQAKLDAATKAFSEGSKWIPLAERQPEPSVSNYIVVRHPSTRAPLVAFVGTEPWDFLADGYTHWMPLPEAPK